MKSSSFLPNLLFIFFCFFLSNNSFAQKSLHLVPLKKDQVKISKKTLRLLKEHAFTADTVLYYVHQGLRKSVNTTSGYQLTEDEGAQSIALTSGRNRAYKAVIRKEEAPPRSKFSFFRLFQPKKRTFSVLMPKDTMVVSQSGVRSFQEKGAQYTLILTALKYKNLGKRNIDFRNRTKTELHYVLVNQSGKILTRYKYVQYFHFESSMRKDVIRHYATSIGQEGGAQVLTWIK